VARPIPRDPPVISAIWLASCMVALPCHCEARSAEAISCVTKRQRFVTREIASALRASQ
jgi:predicted metal-binding protein